MTVCNMSIEAGARAGMIAPDETTYAYLKGRPHAPSGADWDAAVAEWNRTHKQQYKKWRFIRDFERARKLIIYFGREATPQPKNEAISLRTFEVAMGKGLVALLVSCLRQSLWCREVEPRGARSKGGLVLAESDR